MSRVCKKCKSSEIEVDRAKGITYCTECGDVLEESIIVSEVQIEEGAGGGCNIVGQFVGANGKEKQFNFLFCIEKNNILKTLAEFQSTAYSTDCASQPRSRCKTASD